MVLSKTEMMLKNLSMNLNTGLGAVNPSDFNDVMNGSGLQISTIKNKMGADAAKRVISIIIAELSQNINVGKAMTVEQIKYAAPIIYEKYWHLTVDDFKLFLKQALEGKFGKSFDRIDVMVICEWLDIYCHNRNEAYTQKSIKQHTEVKTTFNNIYETVSGPVLEAIKSAVANTEEKAKVEPVKREQTEGQKLANVINKEFYEILKKQDPTLVKTGKAFINYKGKKMDFTEFLEARVKEMADANTDFRK